jgi:hypothetical protein
MKLNFRKYLAIGFVVLAMALICLLANPPSKEGVDDTLVRLDKIETHDKEQDEEIDELKKQFEESKARISSGEKQANSAIGNMQMVV